MQQICNKYHLLHLVGILFRHTTLCSAHILKIFLISMTDKPRSPSCRSLNAMVAESKKCPFGVNSTTELKNIRQQQQLAGCVLTEKCDGNVGFSCHIFSSILVLTPNDNFLVVPLLHSVSNVCMYIYIYIYVYIYTHT